MFKTASKLIGGSKPGCPPCVCNKQAQPVKAQPVKAQPKKKTPWYEKIDQNLDIGGGWFDFGKPPVKKRPKKKTLGPTLKQLQTLARRNKVNIYKMRKDRRGYTKMPLTAKALKARLSRYRISYKHLIKRRCPKTGKAVCKCKNNKASRPRPRSRPRPKTVRRKSYVRRPPVRNMILNPRRGCPVGKYKDPVTGRCKTIPKYDDLDELDSVNFSWNSDRTFGNRPLSMQYSRYGHSCFGDIPCDCGL